MQIDRTTTGGMPPRKVRKKTPPAAAASGRSILIGDIPDGALQRVLSVLPAQEAVRTCVLAQRWRHVWKSTPGLRILCGGKERREFADSLLRVRGCTPIDTCEFCILKLEEVDVQRIDVWIRQVLQCKVRVLRINQVHIHRQQDEDEDEDDPRDYVPVSLPLISQHLKKLQLQNISGIHSGLLDFSSCPVLEDLEIHGCDLFFAHALLSQSLKRLSIADCRFPWLHMYISAPNLVSLWLEVDKGHALEVVPFLEAMPSLVDAVAKINNYNWGMYGPPNASLLHSLSEAQSLALLGHDMQRKIRKLKSYPMFNKLKTLHINEYWCEPLELSSLAHLLEHSPVLEKLILQLYSEGPKHNVELKLSCKPMEKLTATSQQLSTVEIKCDALDARVLNVLKFLGKLNICHPASLTWCGFQFIGTEGSA